MSDPTSLKACHCCGLVHHVPALGPDELATCTRCGAPVSRSSAKAASNEWAAAATWGALVLYPLGVALPVIRVSEFGHAREDSILSGTVTLLSNGDWFVGGVVLVCSIVIPILKLLGLLLITSGHGRLSRRHKATAYRLIEVVGRWGMVDVLLVALLVAFIKIGDLVEVSPGAGVIAFGASVFLSLVASTTFRPHALWELEA